MDKISLIEASLSNSTCIDGQLDMNVVSAKKILMEQVKIPIPLRLWGGFWYEGEVSCLFSNSNAGKSILSVQIGVDVARNTGKKVIYFDFELSDKQFQMRYTGDNNELFDFPDNFYRGSLKRGTRSNGDFMVDALALIERKAIDIGADVLIIDNLTKICQSSEKSESAGPFMDALISLKMQYGWSILIIGHTTKAYRECYPLTQNDLGGSKALVNFVDSLFAIGRSVQDDSLRYVKMLKNRNEEFDMSKVRVYSIEKINSFLQFVYQRDSKERDLLREFSESEEEKVTKQVLYYRDQEKTIREIAALMKMSKSKVHRIISEHKSDSKERDSLREYSESEKEKVAKQVLYYRDQGKTIRDIAVIMKMSKSKVHMIISEHKSEGLNFAGSD